MLACVYLSKKKKVIWNTFGLWDSTFSIVNDVCVCVFVSMSMYVRGKIAVKLTQRDDVAAAETSQLKAPQSIGSLCR